MRQRLSLMDWPISWPKSKAKNSCPAAKLNLKITEVPIRYRQRTYGSTNINRFADGSLLLRMCAKAAAKLFFVRYR